VKALPGKPYDSHTLATVVHDMEALVGNTIQRILVDKGYRGYNAPPGCEFRVFISGQKRGVTPKIKRELRRRSAVEPVIGHLKAEHRMGRNYLWCRHGNANNGVLTAVGYNFRRLKSSRSTIAGRMTSWRSHCRCRCANRDLRAGGAGGV
jgi:hypothetical protein